MQLGNGGTAGSIAGDVLDNGVLVFDRSDDITFGGLISGYGRVVKRGAGALVLTGVNSYTGGTSVEQGVLEVLPGTSLGTGMIGVGSTSGEVTGQLLKVDSGVQLPNAVFLYTGATLDNAGAIPGQVGFESVGSSASSDVTIVNRDLASIEGDSTAILLQGGGTISNGNGSLIKGGGVSIVSKGGPTSIDNDGGSIIGEGGSAIILNGTAAAVTNIHGGTIQGVAAGVVLSHQGTVLNGAGSSISASAYNARAISMFDGGTITNDGGTLTAPGAAITIYSGAGIIDNQGGGSIIGDVEMDASATNKVTLEAGSSIHGNLSIGSNVDSALVLSGDNGLPQSYSDAVSGTTTFASILSKEGAGTWILDTGDLSGVTETDINHGTLRSTGLLAGLVNVAEQGTLDGVPGVVGTLSNAGRVTVHDGDSTVGGNYLQASTGTLAVSLGSKLDVAGAAALSGGTLEVTGADSGYVSNTHTDVLTASGGVTGTFDQLVKDSGVVFTATTINYDANSVWLDTTGLDVTTAAAGKGVSYTPASMGSAVRVQGAFNQLDDKIASSNLAGVSGEFLKAAGEFQQAPTLLAAQASLQSLSGQLHAASAAMTFQAIDASDRLLSDRLDSLLDRGAAAGVWTHDLRIGGDMARPGYGGVGFQQDGWLVGSDRKMGQSGMAGFAFGQSRGQQQLDRSFDHQRSRSTEATLYTGWLDGNRYVLGRAGFGRFQQDVSRQILLGYRTHGVSTQYNGSYGVAYGESGLHFGQPRGHVTPFVNLQYARIGRDGFAEQGAGGFGLRSNPQGLDRWQAGVGVRAGGRWDFSGGRTVDFSAHAQWQRTLASSGDVFNASLVGLEQWQPLVGIGLSRYSGVLGLNLDAALSAHTTLQFGYDYEMGQRGTAQALSTRMNVAF